MSLSCSLGQSLARQLHPRWRSQRTGTFFWERTTAQSLPLTPIDMMFAAVMALKAYSVRNRLVSWAIRGRGWRPRSMASPQGGAIDRAAGGGWIHTDLVQSSLLGEDCDVSVVS